MGHGILAGWIDPCLVGRRRQGEDPEIEHPIVVFGLLAQRLRQCLDLLHVSRDGVGEGRELERQQLRLRQSQHRAPADAREGDAVGEIGIHESDVVIERVVDGVVLAVVTLAAEADVERGDTEVLQERRVVGPRAEGGQPQLFSVQSPLTRLRVALDHRPGAPPLGDAHSPLRVLDVPGHLIHEALQRMRAIHPEIAAAVAVRVDVGDDLVAKLGGVTLRPLDRSEESRLLGVPGREHEGALRAEALLDQLPNRACLLEHGDHAAHGIGGAVDPGVVVVAPDHPFVGPLGALQDRDHVVGGLTFPVEGQLETHLRRSGAEVIGDG